MITNSLSDSPAASKVDHVDMTRLLKATMRLRPDRILVGEVRDGAALALLKAWNTGHPGAAATVNSAGLLNAWSKVNPVMSKARAVLTKPYLWLMVALLLMLLFGAIDSAHASDATPGGGGGLPWEAPLRLISRSFSGPVAFVIALLGIIACGATLIWGGEVSEFARRIIYLVLVICLIVFANSLLTGALFSGAVVPHDATVSAADLADYAKSHAATLTGVGGR